MIRCLPVLALSLLAALRLPAATPDDLVRQADAAQARQDSRHALELLQTADGLRPNDALILQKIARQYSDLVIEQSDVAGKKHYAEIALEYSQRAVQLNPKDPVNILSLAVCHGKLALYSETRDKVRYSRLIREEAERALALDPGYAWAHHVLGVWNYEVASLGGTTKFLARLFYDELPTGSMAESARHLRRATELDPDEMNHWLELGFAEAALGRIEEARTAWNHGLAMPARGPHDEPPKQRARAALAKLR